MRKILCSILLLMISFGFGCATPYQSCGFAGGYSETQLAPDVFRVSFRGNGYTSRERVQDFAMLRAAEVTLEHGYKYFAIADEANSESVSAFTTPGSAQTTGTAYVYGNQATYSEHTTYDPPQTYFVSKPRTGLLVRGYAEKPEGIHVFDAEFLAASLVDKYNLD